MENADQYLMHAAGIYSLLAWCNEQEKLGTPTKINNQTIYVHTLTSRYFALGISKRKNFSKIPFIAVQPAEAYWMRMIQWDTAYVREKDLNLYLTTQLIHGDNNDYPDIPPFALALSFDTTDKVNLLTNMTDLEGREYSQNEGSVQINFHSKLFGIPVNSLKENEHYLDSNLEIMDYNDLLTRRESDLQSHYSTELPPPFIGDEAAAKSIFNKFWEPLNDAIKDSLKGRKK